MIDLSLRRWDLDPSAPSAGQAVRDLALRVLAPAVVLFAVILGLGWIVVGPLDDLPAETEISVDVQEGRTSFWDSVTAVWSQLGNTEIIIGVCVVAVAIVWWRTRQWWYAAVPAIAISVQASVFVLASAIVGRERPDVAHLDPAPPTSSFPSGHVGASVALYLSFGLMAQRIERVWLRQVVMVICAVIPVLVAYARLYRGMHHLVDIIVGALNGIVCALLAWHWLRRRSRGGPVAEASSDTRVA